MISEVKSFMKIAIVTAGVLPVPPTRGGAVENLVYTLINENEKSNNPIKIDVYSIPCDKAISIEEKYTRYYFNKYNWFERNIIYKNKFITKVLNKFNLSNYFKFVKRELKNKQYDCIIVENRPQYVKSISNINNSKILLHMHNDHMVKNKTKGIEIANKWNKIIVVSEYIKRSLISNLSIDDKKVRVLHNGVDTQRFCKELVSNIDKDKIREHFKIYKDDFVVLFSGRLIKEKGILEVIEAVNKLNNINNLKLLIVGSTWYGSNSKSSFVKEIQKKSENIKDKIVFTGYINYEDINNIYSIADIIVLPSMWDDPFPLTVLESMSMSVPVITTISGGIPEMFKRNDGILLNRDDNLIDNLANEIRNLYNDTNLRKEIGDNARKRVELRFKNKIFYDNFIKVIRKEV